MNCIVSCYFVDRILLFWTNRIYIYMHIYMRIYIYNLSKTYLIISIEYWNNVFIYSKCYKKKIVQCAMIIYVSKCRYLTYKYILMLNLNWINIMTIIILKYCSHNYLLCSSCFLNPTAYLCHLSNLLIYSCIYVFQFQWLRYGISFNVYKCQFIELNLLIHFMCTHTSSFDSNSLQFRRFPCASSHSFLTKSYKISIPARLGTTAIVGNIDTHTQNIQHKCEENLYIVYCNMLWVIFKYPQKLKSSIFILHICWHN